MEEDTVTTRAESFPKPSWKKSSENEKDNFIQHLHVLLSDLVVKDEVSQCENVHCTNPNHLEATDDLIIGILESIDKAASENLHNVVQKSAGRKCPIPGWTDAVKPFNDNAFFCGIKYGNRLEDQLILSYTV